MNRTRSAVRWLPRRVSAAIVIGAGLFIGTRKGRRT